MVNCCSVLNCKNNSLDHPNLSFFSMPSDPVRQITWLPLIGRDEWILLEPDVISRRRICKAHFSARMISFSRLKKDAEPDIFEDGVGFKGERCGRGRILKKNAVPSQNLPKQSDLCKKVKKATRAKETKRRNKRLSEHEVELLECGMKIPKNESGSDNDEDPIKKSEMKAPIRLSEAKNRDKCISEYEQEFVKCGNIIPKDEPLSDHEDEDIVLERGGVKGQDDITANENVENVVPCVGQEVEYLQCHENEIVKDEPMSDDEPECDPDVVQERPLGDEIFRVCRTCLKIMKSEDTVPLVVSGPGRITELYRRLTGILQLDLLPVKNSCVCKNCESFINAVHEFKVTCNANETVLNEFDWSNKTKDLLHVVDQDALKIVYDQCNESKEIHSNSIIEENVDPPPTEDVSRVEVDWDQVWKEQDEKGNGLSDMEDHWPCTNETKVSEHDYAAQEIKLSASSLFKDDIDIFSPAFDDYLKRWGGRTTTILRKKLKKCHLNDEGSGPFICEFCGKLTDSKLLYTKHMKIHKLGAGFYCQECDKILDEWTSYKNHCKLEHGGFPKNFKCQSCDRQYHNKKLLDSHNKIHELENSDYSCLICRKPFDSQREFEIHRAVHRPQKHLCKFCGLHFFKNDLGRHIKLKHLSSHFSRVMRARKLFKCNICEKKYFKKGCLDLHKKQSHKEVDSAACPSYSVQKNKVEDTLDDFVRNYEISVGGMQEHVTIVFDE